MNIIGGLIFGVGSAILGYCPGTIAGAIGNGALDDLVGGLAGILIGSGLFAALYLRLSQGILQKGDFGDLTFPRLFKVNSWVVVIPVATLIFLVGQVPTSPTSTAHLCVPIQWGECSYPH